LWNHKLPDRSAQCPGTCTKEYDYILENAPRERSYYKARPKLIKVEPTALRTRASSAGEVVRRGQFRTMPYENWLNRWERKFGVKIPDENVRKLTNGRFIRREQK